MRCDVYEQFKSFEWLLTIKNRNGITDHEGLFLVGFLLLVISLFFPHRDNYSFFVFSEKIGREVKYSFSEEKTEGGFRLTKLMVPPT